MAEHTISTLDHTDENGEKLKVTIEGKTDMPFWEHDLKIKAAIALLNTVDRKHFFEVRKEVEFEESMNELQELLNFIRF